MKTLAIIVIVLIAGVHSELQDSEKKQILKAIRTVCVHETELSSNDVRSIIRAIQPVKKVIHTSKCIVNKVKHLQESKQPQESPVNKQAALSIKLDLPELINGLTGTLLEKCDALLGSSLCGPVGDLLQEVVETVQIESSDESNSAKSEDSSVREESSVVSNSSETVEN